MLLNLLETFPKVKRDINSRKKNKSYNRELALKFDKEYFDGTRDQGYGGYSYDGRWVKVADKIKKIYELNKQAKILDVGCAKGYLLHDLYELNPYFDLYGIDISSYAINQSPETIRNKILCINCKELPFKDKYFDFTISINTVHNLELEECKNDIAEIQRVSKGKSFIQVDAYRDDRDLEVFKDWMLTAKTYLKPEQWLDLFREVGYTGDYYWTILESDGSVV